MQEFEKFVGQLSDFVWGPPLLILLLGTHIFLTFRLRFIQRYLGKAIKLSLQRSHEGQGDVSPFGALTTALAATIGTGNIIGVATAIAAGGPGAVLWMWLTGVFGIATKYSEAVLSVKYRIKTKTGLMAGGPMYVLERGMKQKWLGVIFAILTAISAFGIGNMVQANSISSMVNETFHIAPWITGVAMAVLTAFVILGGIKSIAKVCEALVPFMAIFYVGGCALLLIMNASGIPATLQLIFQDAFTGQAMIGTHCCRRRANQKPRAPGARFFYWNILGYGRCLRDDWVSAGQLWRMGQRPEGRGAHKGRVLRHSHRGPDHSDNGSADLRVFHDFGMVVLRRKGRGISSGNKSHQALSLAVGSRSTGRFGSVASDCLVVSGRDKRPDGNSKPHLAHRAQWRHRC